MKYELKKHVGKKLQIVYYIKERAIQSDKINVWHMYVQSSNEKEFFSSELFDLCIEYVNNLKFGVWSII